ncbi:MAG TPA: DNA repair protein RecO [Rhodocyclaceae bacterium]
MGKKRVDDEPAFVLHSYPFRETSLIVEAWSRNHGRVALLARGARRPRSAIRGLLLAFQPLELSWAGQGEVMTLMKAEWVGGQPMLGGAALFCGYYLNELVLKLLPREDAHERLYDRYAETLVRLTNGVEEASLRSFETDLLRELGYGLSLARDTEGRPIDPDSQYRYAIERGAERVEASAGSDLISGKTLVDLAAGAYGDPKTLAQSKRLMRSLINHYLAGRELASREIYRELQDL